MAARMKSKSRQPVARRARKKANSAPEPDLDHDEESDDDLKEDLAETWLSDEDLKAMIDDGDPSDLQELIEEEETEAFVRRRRIDDEEAAWQEEALGDWHDLQSYRREYNDY